MRLPDSYDDYKEREYLELMAHLKATEMFTDNPRMKIEQDKVINQRVAITLYNESCLRLSKLSNVSGWLKKRRRTPEIVLKHSGHDVGMSISFRVPDEDEEVLLAWDIRPFKCNLEYPLPQVKELIPGALVILTDRGRRWSQDVHGEPLPVGGSRFESHCHPIETRYEVYQRERATGKSPTEAAHIAATIELQPLHRYAPEKARISCWCGQTLNFRWHMLVKNIERSLRPGHTRIEDKSIVTTVPLY